MSTAMLTAQEAPATAADAVREADWPESSCYLDLWMGALAAQGHQPLAMMPFVLALDFEGDQFTFLKPPLEDLARLYGVLVQELALYGGLEAQVVRQVAQRRMVLIEVDAFHLPDVGTTSYRREHRKTTIGIDRIDAAAQSMEYFHNAGYFSVEGEDYAALLRQDLPENTPLLPPYAEFTKPCGAALTGSALRAASLELVRKYLGRAPASSPISALAQVLPTDLPGLIAAPAGFHDYAFNTLRQLGAGFERLGDYAAWLAEGPDGLPQAAAAIAPCRAISAEAKIFQFRLARSVGRRRVDDHGPALQRLAEHHAEALAAFRAIPGAEVA